MATSQQGTYMAFSAIGGCGAQPAVVGYMFVVPGPVGRVGAQKTIASGAAPAFGAPSAGGFKPAASAARRMGFVILAPLLELQLAALVQTRDELSELQRLRLFVTPLTPFMGRQSDRTRAPRELRQREVRLGSQVHRASCLSHLLLEVICACTEPIGPWT